MALTTLRANSVASRSCAAKLIEALAKPERFLLIRQAARETALKRYDQRHLLPKMIDFVERHGPKGK